MVNFLIGIPECDSHSATLLDLSISSDTSVCSTAAFPTLGNSYHVVVSVFIDFLSNCKRDAHFRLTAYDYFRADWDDLRDHLRDVALEDISKLGACATGAEFCEWVQIEIDVYNPLRKCQVKPHSSTRFSAACAAVIALRNHFFSL